MNSSWTSLVFDRPPHSERSLESIAADALRRHPNILPDGPGPIRIDQFVEETFGFNETYERLERGVLGEIHFGVEDRPLAIRLARRLGDLRYPTRELEQERRITLAHECAHGIAHSGLFSDSLRRERAPLLPGFADRRTYIAWRGRDRAVGNSRPSRTTAAELWLEWEANYPMAALLLPRQLVMRLISPWVAGAPDGVSFRYLPPDRRRVAVASMADTFDVTLDLAAGRLDAIVVGRIPHPDFFEKQIRTRSRHHTKPLLRARERSRSWSK
jgi:hypothetical protein